jgi:hypothetical protein
MEGLTRKLKTTELCEGFCYKLWTRSNLDCAHGDKLKMSLCFEVKIWTITLLGLSAVDLDMNLNKFVGRIVFSHLYVSVTGSLS